MKPTITALFTSAVLAASAAAGTTALDPSSGASGMTSTADEPWQFTLGLYGWAAGLDGTLGAAGYAAPVKLSFSDILDTLDMSAMGVGELRKGNWMFQFEGLYLRNSVKDVIATTPVLRIPITAKLTAETTRLEAVVGYRLLDNGTTTLDLLAGAVYYDISNTLNFYGPRAVRGLESGDAWIDPVIGLRLHQRLDRKSVV